MDGASRPHQHVPELDGIRGIACVSVLLAHCLIGPLQVPRDSLLGAVKSYSLPHLLGGVDLFFVLSGFLIGGILLDNKGSPNYFVAFWVRRAARILPVLFILLATYAIALTVQAHFKIGFMDKWLLAEPRPPFWTYATFMQSLPIAMGGYGGPRWVGITWSLAIEEQFYMIFPFLVYLLSRRPLLWFTIGAIFAAVGFRALLGWHFGNWYAPYVLLPSRMDSLLLGVLVAFIVRNTAALDQARQYRYVLDAVLLILAYMIATRHPALKIIPSPVPGTPLLKPTLIAVMYAILILRISLYGRQDWVNRILQNRVLGWFGLISYALYMYHQAVNGLAHGILFNDEPRVASWAQAATSVLVMGLATWLAWLSYLYVEKPIRTVGQRVKYKPVPLPPDLTGR